jgi:hypothetical protein
MRSTASRRVKTGPLEREIEAALQPGRFIGYGDAWSFAEPLNRLERKIAKLALDAPARAVALYETFLAGSYAKVEELDDSSGGFGMFVEGLFCGWVKACQLSGADPEDTARWLIARMDDDPYGFCDQIERSLVKVFNKRGLAAFERCVRERFEGKVPATGPGGRNCEVASAQRRAVEILRAVLAQRRNVDAYVALCESTELSCSRRASSPPTRSHGSNGGSRSAESEVCRPPIGSSRSSNATCS